MPRKAPVILPVATALASLGMASATVDNASANIADESNAQLQNKSVAKTAEPNLIFKAGEDLLGLIITERADGTVVADHSSHASHASHSSHSSHYSGR